MLDEEELGALEGWRGPLSLEVVEDWVHQSALVALLRGQINVHSETLGTDVLTMLEQAVLGVHSREDHSDWSWFGTSLRAEHATNARGGNGQQEGSRGRAGQFCKEAVDRIHGAGPLYLWNSEEHGIGCAG